MDFSAAIKSPSLSPPSLARLPTWEEHQRRRWIWVALLIAIVVWGLTDVRRRARVDLDNPTAHKTDFTVYTEAGAAFFDGRDPYEVTNPRGWHYLYPPLFAILVAPLAWMDTQLQAVVWYFVSVAAGFGMWYECRRLWRWLVANDFVRSATVPQLHPPRRASFGHNLQNFTNEHAAGAPPAWLGWLAAAAVALPVMNCLQRGQVGVVLTYLLLIGLRLVVASVSMRGVFLGGIALALAVTIKLTPLLPAAFFALLLLAKAWRNHRGYAETLIERLSRGPVHRAVATVAGGCAGLVLFAGIIPGSFIGHSQNVTHLRTWVSRVVANDEVGIDNDFNARSKRNQSLASAVRRLGNRLAFAAGVGPDDRQVDDLSQQNIKMPMESDLVNAGLRFAAFGLVGLLLVAGWRIAGRGDVSGLVAMFGLACAATLAVSPISWGHHYVVWLPALVFVPFWMWNNHRRALAIGMVESALVLIAAHYILLDHAGRVGLLGIGATVWFVVATVTVGWSRGIRSAAPEEAVAAPRSDRAITRRRAA